MNLEVEDGAVLEDLVKVLSGMGVEYELEESRVSGNFNSSNAYFVFKKSERLERVLAEGINLNWNVGIDGSFHCPISTLSESWTDIKAFLCKLGEEISQSFALSFQYESVYSISVGGRVEFFKDMVA